ncbi:AI-2E family transporter [Bengtsoniella intestinalis]|uniref:AI-2E family transporter n=1 Tax=Bengtsoniella intestinalis TaxID=3073143 RepID=UPI00391F8BC8
MDQQTVRHWAWLIAGGIAFYSILQHFAVVLAGFSWVLGLLTPFFIGIAIAFILNVPMRRIEKALFSKARKRRGYARAVALIVTLLAFAGVIWLATALIIPNLQEALSSLPNQIVTATNNVSAYVQTLSITNQDVEYFLSHLNLNWEELYKSVLTMTQTVANTALSSGTTLLSGMVSGVTNFLVGLVFSFYLLLQKEKLARQGRMVLYALFPKEVAAKSVEVVHLCDKVFSSFLSGQCLEAVILGSLFVIAMSLFQMPYALLIGVLVSITALIPLVGAFIGCVVGIFLIALINPMQAVAFLVLFLVIQQIEGNLIYPHVVGNSVGLPSIWVLAAVYIGGNLWGIVGMLVFIPLSSVFYALFREFVYMRLEKRNLKVEDLSPTKEDL